MISKTRNVLRRAILTAVGQIGKNGQCAVHRVAKYVQESAITLNLKMMEKSVPALKLNKWIVQAISVNEMRLLWTHCPTSPP